MKIALIASNRKPIPSADDNVFAPGVLMQGLANNLTELGHEVVFFGPKGSKVNASRVITENLNSVYEDYNDIRVSEPYLFMENEDQYEMVLVSKAFEIIRKEGAFDIVHAHEYNKEVNFSNFIDTPLLITGHGMYCESMSSPADKARFEKYKTSCYWAYVSEFHKKDVDLNFVGKVPWGVDPEVFTFNKKGGDSLIFISRLIQRKKPDFAIRVAEKSNSKINVAGTKGINPAHIKYWDSIQPELKKPHVTFLGHVPYYETYKKIGNAKALLLPIDIGEPMPVTSLEAMACGTPVIASNVSPMDEIIIHGETGFLVDKDDEDAWVEAINNVDKINRAKCRERFESSFTIRKMAERYVDLYKKITDIRKGAK